MADRRKVASFRRRCAVVTLWLEDDLGALRLVRGGATLVVFVGAFGAVRAVARPLACKKMKLETVAHHTVNLLDEALCSGRILFDRGTSSFHSPPESSDRPAALQGDVVVPASVYTAPSFRVEVVHCSCAIFAPEVDELPAVADRFSRRRLWVVFVLKSGRLVLERSPLVHKHS